MTWWNNNDTKLQTIVEKLESMKEYGMVKNLVKTKVMRIIPVRKLVVASHEKAGQIERSDTCKVR